MAWPWRDLLFLHGHIADPELARRLAALSPEQPPSCGDNHVKETLNNLSFSYRHPGAGRDPVALWSVVAKVFKHLLCRENREPEPLGPGLRRDDDWERVIQASPKTPEKLARRTFVALRRCLGIGDGEVRTQ